ncbi:MAG: DHH family phosphoesterase, partial [Ruminococcaceae bacterium]|nr:DHH family phosphoesterase [Oscillospiraceae bacterium]
LYCVLPYIYPRTLIQLMGSESSYVSYGNKEFTVYHSKADNTNILYFIDDTYFKTVNRKFKEKRTVVSIISFDNREELTRDVNGGDESRIIGEVENYLRRWTEELLEGFIKKLSGGRYLVITDEAHIEKARERRFRILDEVRNIKGVNNLSPTLSIGIGREASSVMESEAWARQALDMALGRGGDQVAMKKGDTYEFFGGLSKGVEKRDKVRTRVIASTLLEQIRQNNKVLIMGHKNSDMDCVGAAVGLYSAITSSINKPVNIVIDKERTLALPLIQMVESQCGRDDIFITPYEARQQANEKTLLIVVDTHSYVFVEDPHLLDICKKIVVIDHHRMMVTHIKNSVIFYHEPYASSASEMVSELIQYMEKCSIKEYAAHALFSGIALDTKNFILKTGVRTFEASAYLRRCGADTVLVKKLFANTPETNKEKSDLVGHADIYKGCAISYTEDGGPNVRVAAAQAADELLLIKGVVASFVLFKIGNDVNISARSFGELNVQVILEAFGGGGHLTMAGAQLKETTIETAIKELMFQIDMRLEQQS